ncbi:hypothetical protein CEXT_670541 [Caerostris extrusa]|uniref:Uncharacterized protein n=1 Tax=Caerostris extrusa TaxID=172846 RepID=A0AAV4PFH2_CAEEX|nr:hypothetical protein CEXT_670541 [Caerostris extrusa]
MGMLWTGNDTTKTFHTLYAGYSNPTPTISTDGTLDICDMGISRAGTTYSLNYTRSATEELFEYKDNLERRLITPSNWHADGTMRFTEEKTRQQSLESRYSIFRNQWMLRSKILLAIATSETTLSFNYRLSRLQKDYLESHQVKWTGKQLLGKIATTICGLLHHTIVRSLMMRPWHDIILAHHHTH